MMRKGPWWLKKGVYDGRFLHCGGLQAELAFLCLFLFSYYGGLLFVLLVLFYFHDLEDNGFQFLATESWRRIVYYGYRREIVDWMRAKDAMVTGNVQCAVDAGFFLSCYKSCVFFSLVFYKITFKLYSLVFSSL